MPTAGWLRRQDLPTDASGRTYIDPASLDQILDQFVNWRGTVNTGANAFIGSAIASSGNIDASGWLGSGTYLTKTLGTAAGSVIHSFRAAVINVNQDIIDLKNERLLAGSSWESTQWALRRAVDIYTGAALVWRGWDIGFETAGAIRLWVMQGGNVGIGTVSPFDKLHVVSGGSTSMQWIESTHATPVWVGMRFQMTGRRWATFTAGPGAGANGVYTIMDETDNKTRLEITPGGPTHIRGIAANQDALLVSGVPGKYLAIKPETVADQCLIAYFTGAAWGDLYFPGVTVVESMRLKTGGIYRAVTVDANGFLKVI